MSYHSKSTEDKQCFSGGSPEIGKGLLDELERLRHYIANLEGRQDEHGELEDKLRRSEELYRSLVESSLDLIFQCDRNGPALPLSIRPGSTPLAMA
jgi:PAS domain-containing protein